MTSSAVPLPLRPRCPGILTPSNEEEEPFAQALGGIGHDDGCMQVAALHEHPEEVGDHEVIEDGSDAAAPDLYVGRGGQRLLQAVSGSILPSQSSKAQDLPKGVFGYGIKQHRSLRRFILPRLSHSVG
jgi:hypothetical protein